MEGSLLFMCFNGFFLIHRYNAVTGEWVEDEVVIKMASQVRISMDPYYLKLMFYITFLLQIYNK